MSNPMTQVWPLMPGDDTCPYCNAKLNIMDRKEGMYTLECPNCRERFYTEADLFDRMMTAPRSRKNLREWPM